MDGSDAKVEMKGIKEEIDDSQCSWSVPYTGSTPDREEIMRALKDSPGDSFSRVKHESPRPGIDEIMREIMNQPSVSGISQLSDVSGTSGTSSRLPKIESQSPESGSTGEHMILTRVLREMMDQSEIWGIVPKTEGQSPGSPEIPRKTKILDRGMNHQLITHDDESHSSEELIDKALELCLSPPGTSGGSEGESSLDELISKALEESPRKIPEQEEVLEPTASPGASTVARNKFCEGMSILDDPGREFHVVESDDEDDVDEFTPRPRGGVQGEIVLGDVSNENNRNVGNRSGGRGGGDYFYRKRYTDDENRAMIEILIREGSIQSAVNLDYWRHVEELGLSRLRGRSGKSLYNHFMRFLVEKRYKFYTKDPEALKEFQKLHD
ncbi:uncharacterized protein [Fopius arisanus]|uniref:Uncharacterized protein n=1 Tax=Fopius arisanus TaxID=64838 RepID=A0A9R1TGG8_9HYME|nr:PREDICTED: uncharacterized protein LOC105269999 [Fopius arisanus]